uniref:hypothetical protein n=1 Tax=Halarchaeum acidiphilum TaxID=489138 RepID=UPI00067767AD|nr:hypothetical protein [Halarchaeum acidiphilum]
MPVTTTTAGRSLRHDPSTRVTRAGRLSVAVPPTPPTGLSRTSDRFAARIAYGRPPIVAGSGTVARTRTDPVGVLGTASSIATALVASTRAPRVDAASAFAAGTMPPYSVGDTSAT